MPRKKAEVTEVTETTETKPTETIETIDFHGLTIRPFGVAKNTKELTPVRLMLSADVVWTLKRAAFEAHCSLGEMCRAIVLQWLSEHDDIFQK